MNIGLDPNKSEMVTKGLNNYLANLNVLFIKLHNFHWNVVGMGFFVFHEKLEELYEATAEELDRVAERILMLGYKPLASMQDYLQAATVKEAPSIDYNSSTIAQIVIKDYEIVLMQIREIIEFAKANNDECTIALLADAICFYEKQLWMMKAYLTRPANIGPDK